jgi:hypothetical protein
MMDGRNISDEGGGAPEVVLAPGSSVLGAAARNQAYIPTEADRRRDALYAATNSAGGQFLSTEELLKRARAIDDFIVGNEQAS